MRRLVLLALGLALVGLVTFLFLTQPRPRSMAVFDGLQGDTTHGEAVFWAAGCASCHMAPKATGAAELLLAGGQRFDSPFGTFLAPNISPDPDQGIGGWTIQAFAYAIQDGVSPAGQHYFPALPYAAFSKMEPQDVVDLKSFIDTLPASAIASLPHEVPFPFNIRRAVGIWKLLFLNKDFHLQGDLSAEVARGRYIVEAEAHCTECHTRRNFMGGLVTSAWLGGAPNPAGKGTIPNITPGALSWSPDEIFAFLTTGFKPDFDMVGGSMSHVVDNMARLPESDVRAVVAYLKSVAPVPK